MTLRKQWIGLLSVAALLLPAALTHAKVLTLSGESFAGTPEITSENCDSPGQPSFTYAVSGVASGPYPGFFTETGTVTFGQPPFPGATAPITDFEATFTITPDPADKRSRFIQVTGTKEPDPLRLGDGRCGEVSGSATDVFQAFVGASYQATITRHNEKTCRDEGLTQIQLQSATEEGETTATFSESFGPPPFATDVADCRDDDEDDN